MIAKDILANLKLICFIIFFIAVMNSLLGYLIRKFKINGLMQNLNSN